MSVSFLKSSPCRAWGWQVLWPTSPLCNLSLTRSRCSTEGEAFYERRLIRFPNLAHAGQKEGCFSEKPLIKDIRIQALGAFLQTHLSQESEAGGSSTRATYPPGLALQSPTQLYGFRTTSPPVRPTHGKSKLMVFEIFLDYFGLFETRDLSGTLIYLVVKANTTVGVYFWGRETPKK